MSDISRRARDVATNLRHGQPLVWASVGVLIAVGVGLFWALPGGDQTAADPSIAEASGSGAQGSGGDATSVPVTTGPGAGADESDDGSPSPGAGAESTSSGGGESENQAPAIEGPGLSSDGMLLRIAPTVTDPDGDEVTLLFDVDGTEVDPLQSCHEHPSCKGEEIASATPTKASVQFDPLEVGYQYEVPVTIIATDSLGATTRADFTHLVESISTVSVSPVSFRVLNPGPCIDADLNWANVQISRRLSGIFDDEDTDLFTLRNLNNEVTLLSRSTTTSRGELPTVRSDIELLLHGKRLELTDERHQTGNITQNLMLYGCHLEVSSEVTVDTR